MSTAADTTIDVIDNVWLKNLKECDKLDVYNLYPRPEWRVARIRKMNGNNMLLLYNGKQKWFDITNPKHFKLLQPLNSSAPFHHIIKIEQESLHNNNNNKQRRKNKPKKCRTTSSKICIFCNKQYCTKCALIQVEVEENEDNNNKKISFQCRRCTIQIEYDQIFNTISNLFDDNLKYNDLMIDINIIHIITEYSIGYIIQCNNSKTCRKEIIITNRFDFIHNHYKYKLDNLDNSETHYHSYDNVSIPYHVSINPYYSPMTLTRIYGEDIRIFCSKCNGEKLKKCSYSKYSACKIREIEFGIPANKEIYNKRICKNHPFCSICLYRYPYRLEQCEICNNLFCKFCGIETMIQCKNCIINKELNMIFNAIKQAIYEYVIDDDHIIKVIANYAVGVIVKCCNNKQIDFVNSQYHEKRIKNHKHTICNKDIIFANRFRFEQNFDINAKKIFKYTFDPQQYSSFYERNCYEMIEIYDKQTRIFCNLCTLNEINKCDYNICEFKEIEFVNIKLKDKQYSICQYHPTCSICKERKINNVYQYPFYKCCKCGNKFCDDAQCGMSTNNEKICKYCILNQEYKIIIKSIKQCIKYLNNDILDVIGIYSIGYFINCCLCNNIINIDNRMEFENNQQKPIKYYLYFSKQKHKDTLLLYHKNTRIFCKKCYPLKIKKCRVDYCENKDVGVGTNLLCRAHPKCSKCNKQQQYTNNPYSYWPTLRVKVIRCAIPKCDKYICDQCNVVNNHGLCNHCLNKTHQSQSATFV